MGCAAGAGRGLHTLLLFQCAHVWDTAMAHIAVEEADWWRNGAVLLCVQGRHAADCAEMLINHSPRQHCVGTALCALSQF